MLSAARMKFSVEFPYVHRDVDRHGNERLYFRRRMGEIKIRLREKPGTVAFAGEYAAVRARTEGIDAAAGESVAARPKAGTFRWLCAAYFRSTEFQRLDPSTQRARRRILERCLEEPIAPGARETFADFPIKRMTGKAIRVLRDRKANLPEASIGRVKAIRRLFSWAIDHDFLDQDPSRDVKRLTHVSEGHHSWSIEEVEQYEARHPVGSKARLALALFLYTGARRSDVVLLGAQHVSNGWIKFVAQKNRKRKPVTVELPISPAFSSIIAATVTGTRTFLVTEYGEPFTAAGFGAWFRTRCDEAGLPQCSAHGLRKAGAVRAAENGATPHELMAIFGWLSLKEAERYTAAARRRRLSRNATELLKRNTDEA
jgi:site-specific recombinase XerD